MLKPFRCKSLFAILVLGVFFSIPSQEAFSQRWLQTSRLLVEGYENNSAPQALIDTLSQVLSRKDSIMVKREPGGKEMTISDLKDELINEAGYALGSANSVLVDYRFEIQNRGFEESIQAFQFIYRPRAEASNDVRMLYIDASEKWVKDILRNKGTTLTTNQAALKTFSDQLAFARMAESGQVVEIAGETVREGFETEKRQLVQKIQRLTYGSM